jgi:hypothetical protein
MTVRQFLEMFIDEDDQKINIYDNTTGEEVVTKAYLSEVEDTENEKYLDMAIDSIDNLYERTNVITVNISSEVYDYIN